MVRKKDLVSKRKRDLSKKKDFKAAPKQNLRERFTEMLELPKEIVLNMPKLTMLGNGDLIIENYKGIVEYDEGVIRVNTTAGIIKVNGVDIYIKEITSENIMIYGNILLLEFLK
ncbi:MAG TPA: sporulation protein YqfC [Ruminiclostridium sp.]